MHKAIAIVRKEVNDFNRKSEKAALEEFANGPTPERVAAAQTVTYYILKNLKRVQEGTLPEPLDPFCREELARILNSRAYVEYPGKCVFEEECVPDEGEEVKDKVKFVRSKVHYVTFTAKPKEFNDWTLLQRVLYRYLYQAAIFAKTICVPAAKLYLRAALMVEAVKESKDDIMYVPPRELSEADARLVVNLDRAATERLTLEEKFAALPDFKPAPEVGAATKPKAKAKGKTGGKRSKAK